MLTLTIMASAAGGHQLERLLALEYQSALADVDDVGRAPVVRQGVLMGEATTMVLHVVQRA